MEHDLPNNPLRFRVRDAMSADVDAIVAFNRAMAQETERKDLALKVLLPGVRTVIENPTLGRYFVACRGDEVVGQLMITTEWSDWRNGQIWWIQSVYVRVPFSVPTRRAGRRGDSWCGRPATLCGTQQRSRAAGL
jgi:hypothetical protein